MQHDLNAWHARVAEMVTAIGSDSFADRLMAAINVMVPWNQTVMICYQKGRAPVFWYSKVPEARKTAVIDQYLNGCYLLDPWYHAYQHNLPTGLYLLEEIAPDDFFVSEFYREYYQALKVANEAVFAVDLSEEIQIQISMGLMEREISAETRAALAMIAPLVIAAVQKNWCPDSAIAPELSRKAEIIHAHVSDVFDNFGSQQLTAREREIALLIIRGYSLRSIAELLQLAFGTVKVHCKNLYRKLDINSQSELFSLFIDELSYLETGSP